MSPIVLDPTLTGLEELILDGLPLNDATFGLAALSCPPPRQKQEWIGAADSEHQALMRNPLHENRTITVVVQVTPAGDMDGALVKVGDLVDKLQKSSMYSDGVELEWIPAGSTVGCIFDVLAGQITDLPVDWENGWLSKAPTVTIEMICKPYWRAADEVSTSTATASAPFVDLEIENLDGDVPALARLVITDTASQARRHAEWGLEGPLTYDSSTSLLIDSDDMVVGTGYVGSQETGSGYDPGGSGSTNILLANVTPIPAALCGLGDLPHVGVFRVKARIQSLTGYGASLRLSWQVGDGPTVANDWVTPRSSAAWEEHDLGTVTIPATTDGAQRWTGTIETKQATTSYLDLTSGAEVRLDYLILIPAGDGYGKSRADYAYQPGATGLYDDLLGVGNLNGGTATIGGTWASTGGGTDFVYSGFIGMSRASAAIRYGVLGSTVLTDSEATVRFKWGTLGAGTHTTGPIIRWTDSSNYIRATFSNDGTLQIVRTVSGSGVAVASTNLGDAYYDSILDMRCVVYESGRCVAQLVRDGVVLGQVSGINSAAATGGALEDGKVGIFDTTTASTIGVDIYKFFAGVPAAEPLVLNADRSLMINDADVSREDATGVFTGRPATYLGSRFRVPVGASRVLVKARRDDIDVSADPTVTDQTRVQVFYTPRGLVVPR